MSSGEIVRRDYVRLPAWRELSPEARKSVERADLAWRDLAEADAETAPGLADPAAIRALAHPLAAYVVRRPAEPSRSVVEAAVAARMAGPFQAVLGHPEADGRLAQFLEATASAVEGEPVRLRGGPVFTDPGFDGRKVLFPDASGLPGRLRELDDFLSDTEAPRTFRAGVALVAVTNAHPFRQSNGRVARILFNLILQHGDPTGPYVRLHLLGARPPGSLMLFLRAAELQGRWEALFDFCRAAFEVQRAEGRLP